MADIKITDLAAYTAPTSTDVLVVVDVGNDITKKVSIADLLENAGSGAVATPGIAFDGDNDTGIYRPGTNQVAISAGGTQALLAESTGITIPGNLTVSGTTTTIDTTTLVVEDKNIEIGKVSTPTDTTADGGGITLKGASDKTITWVNATDCWTFNQTVDFNGHIRTDSSGRLLIGTSATVTTYKTEIVDDASTNLALVTGSSTGAANCPFLTIRRSRGSTASPSVVLANDLTGVIDFRGYSGAATSYVSCAQISAAVDGTPDSAGDTSDMPGRLVFSTSDDGASSPTERMRIDSDGNVGIGTTSSNRLLQLSQANSTAYSETDFDQNYHVLKLNNTTDSKSVGMQFLIGTNGEAAITATETSDGSTDLAFGTRGGGNRAERLRIDSSGNVGIGATLNYANSLLEVRKAAGGDGVAIRVTNDTTTDGSQAGIIFTNTTADFTSAAIAHKRNDNALIFYNGQSAGGGGFANATERMRIDSSGNVGIGTASPGTIFHVYHATTDTIANFESGDTAVAVNFTASDNSMQIATSGTDGLLKNNGAGSLRLFNNGSERMRIDTSGNVGIGTTSPQYLLQLSSAMGSSPYYIDLETTGSNTVGGGSGISFDSSASNTDSDRYKATIAGVRNSADDGSNDLVFSTTKSAINDNKPVEKMRIDSSGRLLVGTTALVNTSSASNLQVVSDFGSRVCIARSDTTTAAGNLIGAVDFYGNDSDGTYENCARILCEADADHTTDSKLSRLTFYTAGSDPDVAEERLRIDSLGRVGIGTSAPYGVSSTGNSLNIANTSSSAEINFLSSTTGFNALYFGDGATGTDRYRGYLEYAHNGDFMRFATGAAERMRIDSSGRVLIGQSSSPSAGNGQYAKFLVAGYAGGTPGGGVVAIARDEAATAMSDNDDVGALQFTDNNGLTFASVIAYVDGTPGGVNGVPGALAFNTEEAGSDSNPVERMRIDSAGRVGIGTTAPVQALHVVGGTRVGPDGGQNYWQFDETNGLLRVSSNTTKFAITTAGAVTAAGRADFGTTSMDDYAVVGFSNSAVNGGVYSQNNNTSGKIFTGQAGSTEVFVVKADGKVGIGTSAPSQELHVKGGGTVALFEGTGGNGFIGLRDSDESKNAFVGCDDGDLKFQTSGSSFSDKMVIKENGKVGFGAAADSDVMQLSSGQGAGTSYEFLRGMHGNSSIFDGTLSFQVFTNGDVTNSNGNYSQISDAKLKENIVNAKSQWVDLKAVQIRNFNFKAETGNPTHTQIGVVAQELEAVSPGLVFETPDKNSDGEMIGTTTKVVKSSVLYMKALKALQEAMERIEQLEAKVAALEAG